MTFVGQVLTELGTMLALLPEVAGARTIRFAKIVMRQLRTAARLAIIWPFLLLIVSMFGYGFAQIVVPILTLLFLFAALWAMTARWPLGMLAAEAALSTRTRILGEFVEKAREATRVLLIVLGIELLMGVFFSVVPIANDRPLALILIILMAAIACFVGAEKRSHAKVLLREPIVLAAAAPIVPPPTPIVPQVVVRRRSTLADCLLGALIAMVIVLTVIFFLGGRNHLGTFQWPRNANLSSPTQSTSKPSAAHPAYADGIGQHGSSPAKVVRTKVKVKKPPPPPPPEPEILPLSGTAGDIRTVLYPCRYINTGDEIRCRGYLENKNERILNLPVRLCDSYDGQYQIGDQDGGSFHVFISDSSIAFEPEGNMKTMVPGTKYYFDFHFKAPVGVTTVSFILRLGNGEGRFFSSTFQSVPIESN